MSVENTLFTVRVLRRRVVPAARVASKARRLGNCLIALIRGKSTNVSFEGCYQYGI